MRKASVITEWRGMPVVRALPCCLLQCFQQLLTKGLLIVFVMACAIGLRLV